MKSQPNISKHNCLSLVFSLSLTDSNAKTICYFINGRISL